MCGIAGLVRKASREELTSLARGMARSLEHRGPDDEGVWISDTYPVALAHRRLSIQDLSVNGHQPMLSRTGKFVIVFNGEIYNFKSLAKELSGKGYEFLSSSDTEVILAGIQYWGLQETLKRLTGMFAFALFDTETKELTLARDRLGEKPLYYGFLNNTFLFASELKAICCALGSTPPLSNQAISAFLRFGYVPGTNCIYENFYKLEPGSSLTISLPSLEKGELSFSPTPYWSLEAVVKSTSTQKYSNEREALLELERLLERSIADQLVADVSIGAFLSGGIDSSVVTAIAQSISSQPIDTFTIGFKERLFDEAPYARKISKHLGTQHHEIYVSADDCLSLVDDIPKYWDEPFADSSQLPTMLVAKHAKKHVTVCLTGDGGDELFCGYNRYVVANNLVKFRKIPPTAARAIGSLLAKMPTKSWDSFYKLVSAISRKPTQANFGAKVTKFFSLAGISDDVEAYRFLLSAWANPAELVDWAEARSSLEATMPTQITTPLRKAMYWDQLGYLTDDNLVKGDRSSMAYALETRLPLLDRNIVEFSWRLPDTMLVRDGQSKWLLRQLLYKHVPKDLIERPKMGFSAPIARWLRNDLRSWSESLLKDASKILPEQSQPTIKRLWAEHLSGHKDHAHKLWTVLMLIAWNSHFQARDRMRN